MEPIEMIELVCYAISLIACAVLAVYFLRKVQTERTRAFLWWAVGFVLVALGTLVITGVALYGVHRILVMLAFAFAAASVAFLYYAASWRFFDETSFFRGKFAVILFVVSFVLFLLPLYYLPEEHAARIVESPAMILFVAAFLVIAVLFSRFAVSFERITREVSEKKIERRLGALQSLVWILPVWSLCIALFWGSATAVGLVFVLSLLGYTLLLYGCKPERPKKPEKPEKPEKPKKPEETEEVPGEVDKMPMWLKRLTEI